MSGDNCDFVREGSTFQFDVGDSEGLIFLNEFLCVVVVVVGGLPWRINETGTVAFIGPCLVELGEALRRTLWDISRVQIPQFLDSFMNLNNCCTELNKITL